MLRIATGLILLASALPAFGQALPIAYTKLAGSAWEIYLVRPDGTGTTRLYRAPNKVGIGFIDLKPGGGEIAYRENGLRVLSYSAAGVASLPAATLDPCFVEGIDWHPSDGSILYSAACSGVGKVKRYTPGGGTAELFDSQLTSVRWSRDGNSILYLKVGGGGLRALTWRDLASGREVTLYTVTEIGLSTFDMGRTSNVVILSDPADRILKIGFPETFPAEGEAVAVTVTEVERGNNPHFSQSDEQFLFETPHSARGDYLRIKTATGYIAVAPKSTYGLSDWASAAPATQTNFGVREAPGSE